MQHVFSLCVYIAEPVSGKCTEFLQILQMNVNWLLTNCNQSSYQDWSLAESIISIAASQLAASLTEVGKGLYTNVDLKYKSVKLPVTKLGSYAM